MFYILYFDLSIGRNFSIEFLRNLESRETLSGKVHYLELRMAEKDEQIKLLMRRNNLEAKNFKVQLHNEQKKYKTLCQKMENVTTKMHVPIVNEAGEVCLVD